MKIRCKQPWTAVLYLHGQEDDFIKQMKPFVDGTPQLKQPHTVPFMDINAYESGTWSVYSGEYVIIDQEGTVVNTLSPVELSDDYEVLDA